MITPHSTNGAAASEPGAPTATLTELRGMDSRALSALFRRARWEGPARLEGHPRGVALAVAGADRGLRGAVVKAALRGPFNPWQGKSFRLDAAGEGSGTNRVGFGRRSGAFVFRTYETASVVDGQRSLAIDYDVPSNPSFARATYDELRQVGPALWLGRGMARRAGKAPRVLVWFALDGSRQDASVAW